MSTRLFYLHALSAMHVGVGQAVGVVDLPIMRSRSTHLPIVPGSAMKGVLRDEFSQHALQETLFGPEQITGSDGAFSGALAISDAQLLLFPVRSFAGVMAWATCPFVLRRHADDLARCDQAHPALPPPPEPGTVRVTHGSRLRVGGASQNLVVLDDLDLTAQDDPLVEAWATHLGQALFGAEGGSTLVGQLALLSDSDFSFLADTATEVRARVRIDDSKGTVKEGALWYEENLPAESVLWGLIQVGPGRKPRASPDQSAIIEALDSVHERTIQVGGKATVGRGLAQLRLSGSAS